MTNNLRTAIATFILTAAITPATMLAQSAYPVNFDENEAATNTGRYTNAILLSSSYGTQQIDVNQKTEKRLYIKRLDDCLRAKIARRFRLDLIGKVRGCADTHISTSVRTANTMSTTTIMV